VVSGGWITQAGRSRWQQRAAAELAAILAAHPELPVLAWTVTASGGALSGQILAPAAIRRGLLGQWQRALGLEDATETPSAGGMAVDGAHRKSPVLLGESPRLAGLYITRLVMSYHG
jgi:hypothetical protein